LWQQWTVHLHVSLSFSDMMLQHRNSFIFHACF
jgi:hypothetical protein